MRHLLFVVGSRIYILIMLVYNVMKIMRGAQLLNWGAITNMIAVRICLVQKEPGFMRSLQKHNNAHIY